MYLGVVDEPKHFSALELSILKLKLIAFDFDGVFTDNGVYVSQDGAESVRCCRSDGLGLRKLDQIGVDYLIISTEKNPVVAVRAKKLNIKCYQGCDDKFKVLDDILRVHGISWEQTGFVGNDINDLTCLNATGVAFAVDDAYPEVKDISHYLCKRPGGYGAVREICDLIFNIQINKHKP